MAEIIGGITALVILGGLGFLLIKGTKDKNKFGINIKSMTGEQKCPNCGNPLPMARIPKSFSEGLWGGWTCEKCGTKLDKWGRKK